MRIIIALIVLDIVVCIHELGHFLAAKASGIVVEEFSIGMGPKLFSLGKKGTRFSLRLFPIGGSCAMKGEDEDDNTEGSFQSASVWKRMAVVLAGPFFNFVLAFAAALIIIGVIGADPASVTAVEEGSGAYEAGLQEGDRIVRFNGNRIANGREIYMITQLDGVRDEKVRLTVLRDGKKRKFTFDPVVEERYMAGYYYTPENETAVITGIIEGGALEAAGMQTGDVITEVNGTKIETSRDLEQYWEEHPMDGSPETIKYRRYGIPYETVVTPAISRQVTGGFSYNLAREKLGAVSSIGYSFGEVNYMIRLTLKSLASLIRGRFSVRDLSGPIGIVSVIGEVYEEAKEEGGMADALLNLLNMGVLISANLGVMNLLPFPALDGGRFLFLLIAAIRRKPVSQRVEGAFHYAGFILLMFLAVFIAISDVVKLVS